MKILVVWFGLLLTMSYAYTYKELTRDYEAKNYDKVCNDAASQSYLKNEKNEQILVMIGDACAKTDSINPLGNISKNLISTKEYRESGSYFATLLLQKKLIYQFMHDAINLKELTLPRTDHVLSRVFEQLSKGNYKEGTNGIEITTDTMDYLLWLSKDEPKKVYIDEHKDGKLVQRHWYL